MLANKERNIKNENDNKSRRNNKMIRKENEHPRKRCILTYSS